MARTNAAVNVRAATPRDREAIREVHRDSIEGLGPEGYDEDQVAAWAAGCDSADYGAAIGSDEQYVVVAEDEGSVIGFGSLSLEDEGTSEDADVEDEEASATAEVTGVYVHPSVARAGVGSAIYDELERRARESGVRTLELAASRNAVPFYESLGYERVREFTHEFSPHEDTGVYGTVVEMRTDL